MAYRLAFALVLVVALAAARPAAGQVSIIDLENRTYSATEVVLGADGALSFTDSGSSKQVQLRCDTVAELIYPKDGGKNSPGLLRFEWTNGDVFLGEPGEATESGLRVQTADFGVLTLGFEHLDRIVCPGGEAAIPAGQGPEAEDIVFKRNKDSDRGGIKQFDRNGVSLDSTLFGKNVLVPLADLAAIQFSRVAEPPEAGDRLLAIVTGQRGSRITGILKELNRRQITLESLYGETYTLPGSSVASIYFKGGRVVYLSDVQPTQVVERPFYEVVGSDQPGLPWLFPWQRDRAVTGGRLAVKGKEYRKGLGVHASCELTFALAGKFESFQAIAGLDDSATPTEFAQPSVRFVVSVDGKKVWESPVVLWNSAELPVAVPVKGAQTLTLLVDFAGDGDTLDRADWAAARLVR